MRVRPHAGADCCFFATQASATVIMSASLLATTPCFVYTRASSFLLLPLPLPLPFCPCPSHTHLAL